MWLRQAQRIHSFVFKQNRRAPLDNLEYDHGSWDGRWAYMCERDWNTHRQLGMILPVRNTPVEMMDEPHDALAVQASRKEYVWSQLSRSCGVKQQ